MTWAEWVNSEHNTIEAIVSSSNTIQSPQAAGQTLYYDGNIVYSSDTIIDLPNKTNKTVYIKYPKDLHI